MAAARADQIRGYLDSVTERWIGWTFPPVKRAMDDAQWVPDERDSYCGRCGESVGPGEATPDGCGTCRREGVATGHVADGIVRLGSHTGVLRQWILQIKYDCWSEMGECLGTVLGQRVQAAGVVSPERTLVVPMPMPWQRRLYRGIDHAKVIATAVTRQLGAPIASALSKANRAPQVTLAPSERRRSGARGLAIRWRPGGWPLEGLHLLLVDDVCTTGASLRAASRLLQSLGPERVVCAVCAVSDTKARRERSAQPGPGGIEGPTF